MSFRIAKTADAQDLPLPGYMTEGAAGMDLYANVTGDTVIGAGEVALIPLGVVLALPEGYEGQVRSRSGLAAKHMVTVIHGVGTIDWDYRGELMVPLYNHGKAPFTVRRGDRVAQLVISRVERVAWDVRDAIDSAETERGRGGHGSTGI